MKKLSSKILLIVMAVTLILSLNATVNATAEDMAVLENANGDYLIYLNGHLNDEYSYAITTSADVEENNLNWYTAEDTKGNKVIKVSKGQVGSYLWVKIDCRFVKHMSHFIEITRFEIPVFHFLNFNFLYIPNISLLD